MRLLQIGWNSKEDQENVERYQIDFKLACEIVKNSTSYKLRNIDEDYIFIGPTNDLSKILVVNCKLEDGFRKITWSRTATAKEENSYFNHLAEGGLK